jgi:hypothetical protein
MSHLTSSGGIRSLILKSNSDFALSFFILSKKKGLHKNPHVSKP